MSSSQAPKDNLDHILDFFLGSPKNVKRTVVILAIILVIIYIDELITMANILAYKIANFLAGLIPAVIIIRVFYFLFKKAFGKK